jgi:hypothetical protein
MCVHAEDSNERAREFLVTYITTRKLKFQNGK